MTPTRPPTDTEIQRFASLFRGRGDASGTGQGAVRRGVVTPELYRQHLAGEGPDGLGIFPLLDNGKVYFAAVDIDEPDYARAKQFQTMLPDTFVERTRSGNYHVWAFFSNGIEAWVPRAIMRQAAEVIGVPRVEVFPKQEQLREGMIGNYINLPFYGDTRPILYGYDPGRAHFNSAPMPFDTFLLRAEESAKKNALRWRTMAARLGLEPQTSKSAHREQGSKSDLHICAQHIIERRDRNPVVQGHRNVVLFNLAKMLLDYEGFDDAEAFGWVATVNQASPDPMPRSAVIRLFSSAKRGGYTSTGCDDPLMAPYVHPDCPIANGGR